MRRAPVAAVRTVLATALVSAFAMAGLPPPSAARAAEEATEPAATEPAPTEPAPTEPAPTEPAPSEPVPTEPAPTEPVPTEPAPVAAPARDGKGPLGWDVYRRLDRLPELLQGVETRQFSSFDRAGYNDDGFTGRSSCLRLDSSGCVLAERTGPGELQSLWFTRGNGDVRGAGRLRIELDGRRVLDAPLQDVVDGRLGAPFVYPLVANATRSSGGVYIKVPMPFAASMRVSTQANPNFHHVAYRMFADAAGVTTFDPADRALDVLARLGAFGRGDPKPPVAGATTSAALLNVAPGQTASIARVQGSGVLSAVRLLLPQIVGPAPAPPVLVRGTAGDLAGTGVVGDLAGAGVATGGSAAVSLRVDPRNSAVRLVRRGDEAQRGPVLVDGQSVGNFRAATAAGGAVQQTLDLPPELVAGKARVTVANVAVAAGTTLTTTSTVKGQEVRTDVATATGAPASSSAAAAPVTAQTSDELLARVRLRISFDGRRTVDAPLGEFFGSGLGEHTTRSLFFALDPRGWYSSWWPMPFGSEATVELYNGSATPITAGRAEVTSALDAAHGQSLAEGTVGYFHALGRAGAVRPGQDWTVADVRGQGKLVGVTQTMRGAVPGRLYLEGDERIATDGGRTPVLHGTGTEDFYEAGWYFNRGPFSNPFNGLAAHDLARPGCHFECDSAYRLFVGDAVPFGSSLHFGIEHGPNNDVPAAYSSTAFWYGRPTHGLRRVDALDIGDATSEVAHGFSAHLRGQVMPARATFEGDDDGLVITDEARTAGSPVSFRLQVPADNRGVTLRRLSDQARPGQSALVRLGGRDIGLWVQPLHNTSHRWLEDTFLLPPEFTAGSTELAVELVPQGAAGWPAAAYEALAQVAPVADVTPPGAVPGLAAHPVARAAVELSWRPAADDVGVGHYEVHASLDPDVPVARSTLAGITRVPAFAHEAAGVGQRWYYRVRAIDRAGAAGPVSAAIAGTSGGVLRWEGEMVLPARGQVMHRYGPGWSSSAQAFLNGGKAGDAWTTIITVPTLGRYELAGAFTRSPNYGLVALSVDGHPAGRAVDTWAPTLQRPARASFGPVLMTPGQHRITATVVGKRPASLGFRAGLDLLELRYLPATLRAEGEHLAPALAQSLPLVEGLSGGSQLTLPATRSGGRVDATFVAPGAGFYDLSALFTRSPEYGVVAVAVDGRAVGRPFDGYAPVPAAAAPAPLSRVALRAGRHSVTFTNLGKHALATGWGFGVDALDLRYVGPGLWTEGELSAPPRSATASVVAANMGAHSPGWSGHGQLLMRAVRPGAAVAISVDVPRSGRYDISALLTRGPVYGVAGLTVDGRTVGRPFDTWAPVLGPPTRVTYGLMVPLSAGRHTLTLQARGKRAAGLGMYLGLDAFVLEPR